MKSQLTLTFSAASGILGNRASKKIDPNTFLVSVVYRDKRVILVTFHGNTIMELSTEGTKIFKGYGHLSVTTKKRLNSYLPQGVSVFTKAYAPYVTTRQGTAPFVDGMTI